MADPGEVLAQWEPAGDRCAPPLPAQRELAYLTASVTNECHYSVPTHVLLGRAAGLTEDKLAHLGDEPLPEGLYEPDEAAIVRYAQRSTRMDVTDERTYGDLLDHVTEEQIIEICFTVGLANMINRFHATFLTEVDPEKQDALAPGCPLSYPEVPTPVSPAVAVPGGADAVEAG